MRFLSIDKVTGILLSLSLALLFVGCTSQQPTQQALLTSNTSSFQQAIPDLWQRNTAIGSVQEQEKVLSTYELLKQAINQNPTDYRKRIQLAQLFMLEARATGEHGYYYPASLSVLDRILEENPPADVVFGAKSLKASVMLSLHEFKAAKKLAEEAITINGYNALIYGSLVDAHVELGNYKDAVLMADKMMSIRPDIRSYSRVSYLREIHGDLDGAIDAMQLAVKAGYPGYEETAWAGLMLGELLEKQGKLDEAEEVYKGILTERENYPFAIDALAGIEIKRGNYEEAERLLLKACSIIPEVGFYVRLAGLYKELGKGDKAESMLAEILGMLADDEAHGHKMGMEYARIYLEIKGDYEKALEFAQREYTYRPNNKDVNQLMAAIYLKMNRPLIAQPYLEVALQTASTDAELRVMESLLLAAIGEESRAKTQLHTLFEYNPFQVHAFVEEAKNLIGA